jgi:hypothetical protein
LSEIICQSCGKNNKIVLVGQIYAPIEGLDRSLYVFVCNSRTCSLSSKGWTIIRNQKPCTVEDKCEDIISPVESKPKAAVDNTSIWNFPSDQNGLEEDIDLLELLNKRDTKLQTPSSAQKQKNQGSAKKNKLATVKSPFKENPVKEQLTSGDKEVKEDNKLGSLSILAEFQITEIEDPYDEYTAFGGNQLNENELIPFDKNLDSRHIQSLLDSYMKEEDDEEALQALQGYQRSQQANNSLDEKNELLLKPRAEEETTDNSSFFEAATGLKKNSSGLDKSVAKKKSKPKSGLKKIQEDKEDDENDEEEEDEEDDKMGNGDEAVEEKMNEKQKTEFYFQQRISVEPNQVLRYCYNGKPLWITSPSPLDHSSENKKREIIPCCASCGEKRVYECQLMPAILSLISSSSSSSSDKKGSSSSLPTDSSSLSAKDLSNELRQRLGDEFDFGVVTVWSCPNSCPPPSGGTDKFAVEIAIVQPPPDISVW